MDMKKMFERENKNCSRIYLYADLEKGVYYAYEFSAYILTKKFDMPELKEEVNPEIGTILYVLELSPEFVVEQFHGPNITVGDAFTKVILDEPDHCIQWKADFNELKMQQQKANSVLGKTILGFFRISD